MLLSERRAVRYRRPSLSFLLCVLAMTGCARRYAPTMAAVPTAWRSHLLPFKPVSIASNGNLLWVCGADEMIAESVDGGNTWKVKHERAGGEVLLTIRVLGNRMVYSSGTAGLILLSVDGGSTWKSWTAGSQRVLEMIFADTQHGIRELPSSVETTADGGRNWSDVSMMKTDERVRQFSEVLGMAVLDGKHYAMLLHKPQGENMFLSSRDSGMTWKSLHIDNTYAVALFAHGKQYWAFGIEIVERQDHGGYSVPLVLHSRDGLRWVHGAKAPTEFTDCSKQGCVLYEGAIADLYGNKPHYLIYPGDISLTSQWATGPVSICTVAGRILCAAAAWSDRLPPRPESDQPIVGGPLYASPVAPPPDCLVCSLTPFPLDAKLLPQIPVKMNDQDQGQRQMLIPGLQSTLLVRYAIQTDGTVDQVDVDGAPLKEIASSVAANVGNWIFEPPRTSVDRKHEIRLVVVCMGAPSNDEATCNVTIPPQTLQ